jgi:outer membrane lipoprotein carrier protein
MNRACMRRRPAVTLVLVAAVAAAWVPSRTVAAQNADSVLAHAERALDAVRTLRASFVQRVRDQMLGTDETSSGELLLQRPGKFVMRWRRPAGDMILEDGSVLWVYLPSTAPHQVVRTALSGKPGESADFVEEFLDHPAQRFAVSYLRADSVGGRAADVLTLVPRTGNVPYQQVRLWVDRDDGLPRRFEITEAAGSVRRVTLDRLRVNVPIPAASFVFKPPAGARVIDATP